MSCFKLTNYITPWTITIAPFAIKLSDIPTKVLIINVLNVFRNDLKKRKIVNTLQNVDDLEILRATAMNKVFGKYDIK